MYEVRPKVIQDFTVICGLDSPVARKLRPKRRFQTRPCRRRRASVGFPYSRFVCAPASCGFAQHVVRTLPSLWTGASPCCTVSQSDTQNLLCTGYIQNNGTVSKVNKKFISHLTRAQRTPSAAATVQVSHALPAVRFSCLARGRGASLQDGVAVGKGFLCAPF